MLGRSNKVDKATVKPDVSDVCRPNLVWPVDLKSSEQVRIDLVLFIPLAQFWLWVDCLKTHPPHQIPHVLVIDMMSLSMQPRRHPADSVEGHERVLLINQAHQFEFVAWHLLRYVVPA